MSPNHFVLFGLSAASVWLTPLWLVGVGLLVGLAGLMAIGWLLRLAAPESGRHRLDDQQGSHVAAVVLPAHDDRRLWPDSLSLRPLQYAGEDSKMVKDEGLTLIMVLSILMALWTASVSIADEIEGRTALTLLSKPVSRREFIVGKFVGILVPVAIMFLVLGALFLASVSYKVVYDAREGAQTDPSLAECQREMLEIAPGLLLAFMEAVVLTAISVAISTRLPMLANLVSARRFTCSAIWCRSWPIRPWARSSSSASWPTCWPPSCPCSTISTSRRASRPARRCRENTWLGPRSIASSTLPWP